MNVVEIEVLMYGKKKLPIKKKRLFPFETSCFVSLVLRLIFQLSLSLFFLRTF